MQKSLGTSLGMIQSWNRNGGKQKQRANNRRDGCNGENKDKRVELESGVIGEFAVPKRCSGADRESREKQDNVRGIVLENRTNHGVERIPHCRAWTRMTACHLF